jgi:hypothetical protein
MLDIEKLMREGKSLDEIGKMVTNEMNTAQKKIDAEKEAARIAAEKKAEEKRISQRKTDARNAAIAALADYFAFVLPMSKDVDMKTVVGETLDSLEETIKLMSNLTVRYNGKTFSIFDL